MRSVEESPVFAQGPSEARFASDSVESLHVALIEIREPQSINDETLQGVGLTLSQLSRLGLSCVVVIDAEDSQERKSLDGGSLAIEQADRVVEAIDSYGGHGARRVDSVIGISSIHEHFLPSVKVRGGIRITHRDLLLAPLRRGLIPVIAPIGFEPSTQSLVPVVADEVVLALTREFAGIQTRISTEEDPQMVAEKVNNLQKQIILDRIIVLDSLGGIPSMDRSHGSHVFINLEQEFDGIKEDLLDSGRRSVGSSKSGEQSPARKSPATVLTLGNSFSKLRSTESTNMLAKPAKREDLPGQPLEPSKMKHHIRNLELLKNALALLPPSSSAFITTPQEVANSESRPPLHSQGPRVRTRRQRNPLIYNLLTDKPVFSSSLPSTRSPSAALPHSTTLPSTFLKRGMPVTILPPPQTQSWLPPSYTQQSSLLTLSDPRIDLPRLVHLIEDSFARPLNVPHYLSRLHHRLAGIIIAGEYEGGAILTWETPPNAAPGTPPVPYLDKFAVLKRSQGAGGVADIVFKAMVKECFPGGVCWRSRGDNPVNKWYFERAAGTWKMPRSDWTMFWTTEGVEQDAGMFRGYEGVCRSVEPSWADGKRPD